MILLIAGGLACWFYVLSPIHEFSHIVVANILGGGGEIVSWTSAGVWANYSDHRIIRWSGAYGEMIVYLVLYSLIFVWKLWAWGAFWFGAANASLFRTHLLADFNTQPDWSGRPGDEQTAAALMTFHVVFGAILTAGWILFIGREWVYHREVLPFLRPEPPRPFLERVRRRWG